MHAESEGTMESSTPNLNVSSFFGPDGLIAKFKPDFAVRQGQAEFSELITQAINDRVDVIAEAATGFGKSFAVLVPAILAALEGKRVVISTETLTLQDQYVLNDIPILQAACAAAGVTFSYAVAKGRTNYICRARLDEDNYAGTTRMMEWAKAQKMGKHSGDIASIPFEFDPKEWGHVCSGDDCARHACPFYGAGRKGLSDCFVYEGIRRFMNAQIVVANHTLVLLDAGQEAGSILGRYDVLIVDEAHSFAEKAQDTWGITLKPRTVSTKIKLLARMMDRVGVNYFMSGYLGEFRALEDRMFAPFSSVLGQSVALKQLPSGLVEESKRHTQTMIDLLRRTNRDLIDHITQDEGSPQTLVIRACKEKLSNMTSELGAIYGDNLDEAYKDNWLAFLETSYTSRREPYGVLNLKPIAVAPLMRAKIYDVVPTTVFMSATMRIGSSFGFMKRELGIPEGTLEFIGTSPFNYENNVTGYFPTHLPDNTAKEYLPKLAEAIQEVLVHSDGKALVLFTNNSHMRYCYDRVSQAVKHRCYLQGQASKPVLIDMFKSDVSSCLFATRSFFTGVDIPGEALSCVVLTKAPFQVPTEPMFKAKCDRIEEAGESSFALLSLPLMLFDVRQGFGRLIRTTTDTGLFAFLDSRAMRKPYGQRIVNALPNITITDSLGDRGRQQIPKAYSPPKRTADEPSPDALRKTASIEDD